MKKLLIHLTYIMVLEFQMGQWKEPTEILKNYLGYHSDQEIFLE